MSLKIVICLNILIQIKWKWKSLSCVQLFEIPWSTQSMKFSRPECWSGGPFPSPGKSSQPRDQHQVSCITGWFFTGWATGKPKNTGISLLQRLFLTQESNRGLLHCRWILNLLSYQGSPKYLVTLYKTKYVWHILKSCVFHTNDWNSLTQSSKIFV